MRQLQSPPSRPDLGHLGAFTPPRAQAPCPPARRGVASAPGMAAMAAVWLLAASCSKAETAPPSGSAPPAEAKAGAATGAAPAASQPAGPLAVGELPPDVSVTNQDGQSVNLRSFVGSPVVVYFYPKDDTPGCTAEAKGFRDEYAQFQQAGAKLFGVSLDDAESHKAFAAKYELPFPLLADTDGALAKGFGVKVRGSFAARVTFLIGKDGKIAKVWPDVDPGVHAAEVLAAIKAQ